MREAVKIADRHEVTLAFEPEINNVVSSTMRARRLLDEIGSPWLKVVIDPANLVHAGEMGQFVEILDEAFDWLGSGYCPCARERARDLASDGPTRRRRVFWTSCMLGRGRITGAAANQEA